MVRNGMSHRGSFAPSTCLCQNIINLKPCCRNLDSGVITHWIAFATLVIFLQIQQSSPLCYQFEGVSLRDVLRFELPSDRGKSSNSGFSRDNESCSCRPSATQDRSHHLIIITLNTVVVEQLSLRCFLAFVPMSNIATLPPLPEQRGYSMQWIGNFLLECKQGGGCWWLEAMATTTLDTLTRRS